LFTAEEEEEKEKGKEQQQQQRTSFSNGRVENIMARQLRNHGSIPASIQTG
jgi:hypothetical protein